MSKVMRRQRTGGPAGGGGGADDDWGAGGGDLGAARGGGEGGGGGWGGGDVIFLMSCSIACSVATFWSTCPCLAVSCSTLRRTTARSRAIGSSCCTTSREFAGAVGQFAGKSDSNQPSDGTQVLTVSRASDRKSTRLNSSHLGISYAV